MQHNCKVKRLRKAIIRIIISIPNANDKSTLLLVTSTNMFLIPDSALSKYIEDKLCEIM